MAAASADPKKPPALQNRPGEAAFQLEMSADSVLFVSENLGKPIYCDVTIKNPTARRQSFKVKCTNGEIFRVQPPIGFVKPNDSQVIRIWFQNKAIPSAELVHYLAFYHRAVEDGVKEKDAWYRGVKPDGVRRLQAVFQEKK